ncbi:chromosome segregation protein SMC [Hirschia litorea]|uniref:Chromosome partition protein Smc n=1 Tax=Hirschia litorea TaxID=1199156 RepID=A0ABW2IJE2_9PROT
MHFTGLKIVGFKSFADPVDFAIREGLTGIVGPNGCGKSNILESLRWVMGASSARAMRGGEMDDLIFSGSSNRPSRELAEVALILDNSARTAPAELNDSDELEVRRRLKRGAGSTYKINGRTVRAKDVQLLFADASTGANSPALVRQGQISELIASKPQNRRRILEEAAGIAGLNQRRHEAELKLKGAAESLSRLDEIIGEVDKQLNTLKRQASRAKKYRALQEQIDALEIQISYFKWQAAREELTQAQLNVAETEKFAQEAAKLEASALAAEIELREKIPPLREFEAEAAAQLGILKLESARLDGERKAASSAITRLEQDLQRVIDDQSREHSLREEALNSAKRAQVSFDSLPVDNNEHFHAQRETLKSNLEAAREKLISLETQADALSQKLATAQAEENSAKASLQRAQNTLSNLQAEHDRAIASLAELGDIKALEAKQAHLQSILENACAALEAGNIAAHKADQEAQSAREAEKQSFLPLQEAEKNIRALEAEISGLKRLQGHSSAQKSAPILDDTHPEAGLERALAAALGDDLNASTDINDAQFWSDTHGTSASNLPDGVTPLSDLVEAPQTLLARLSQCGLVDAKDGALMQAKLMQGQRLVSRAGDLWRWDGYVRTAKAPSSASEKLEQRARITALEKELMTAKKKADTLRKKQATCTQQAQTTAQAAQTAQRAIPDLTQQAGRAREDTLHNTQAMERLSMRASSINDNIARIEDAHIIAQNDINTAQELLTSGPSENEQKQLDTLRTVIREQRESERNAHNALSDLDNEQARIDGRRHALKREIQDWTRRAETADKRLDDLNIQRTGIRGQLESAKAQPSDLKEQLDELNTQLEAATTKRQDASDAVSALETQLREAESHSRKSRDDVSKARESHIRAETRLESAQRREIEIGENIQSRLSLDFNALKESADNLIASAEESDTDTIFNLSSAEAQLNTLTRERDGLGGVNMEADLQVEETANRLETQLREREDLDQALAKLQEGVHALNAKGRELLLEAFEKVAEHFRVLFEALFEGGEAQLKLTESDDPLQAGLEIFACPPGKKLSALSLMSGGEQALTAAALIFAVFLSQPSPLCVLDEVDAPLDDANVDRFCRMLDTMRSRTDTRFVVITHNPVTMSRMDRLYGVTMQERGVSRLVSVDLQSAEQLVAAQ